MTRRLGLCGLALTLLSVGIAVISPPVACAEPAQNVVRLGYVRAESPTTLTSADAAFFDRLRELGWIEGRNLIVERRWAQGRLDDLPAVMADVVSRGIDVLVTASTPAVLAAKDATTTVPIVIASMGDPMASGVVENLAHPGGNITGLSLGWTEGIPSKWLELLQETIPRLTTVAIIRNPDSALLRLLPKPLDAAAEAMGIRLRYIDVREPEALERAFGLARRHAKAAIVLPDPLLFTYREQVAALAAKNRLPTMYGLREFVEVGSLMAYAPDHVEMFRRAAGYVDRILRGAKPGDLPIQQPTQFALTVNIRTAKALGLAIPQSLLVRAEEIIR